MSGLRGSRNAASLSATIAPFQSSATNAFFPAAKSGSSCAQSDSVPMAVIVVQMGHVSAAPFVSEARLSQPATVSRKAGWPVAYREPPATSPPKITAAAIKRIITLFSLAGEECLGLLGFSALGIGVLRQRGHFVIVLGCFLAIACGVGRASHPEEGAISIWRLLERGLELLQGRGRLPHLKKQFAEELAERIKAVLHRHVFNAAVFAVCGCTHELHRLVG